MGRKKVEINYWAAVNARRLRLREGYKIKDVAEKLNLSRASYNFRELMDVAFLPEEIEALAKLYHTTVDRMSKPCILPPADGRSVYRDDKAKQKAYKIIRQISIFRRNWTGLSGWKLIRRNTGNES